MRADQIISGAIINIFAVTITGYLNLLVSQRSPPSAGQFQDLRLPSFLIDIPVIGPLIDALLGVGLIALSMLVSVILLQVLLFRSRWGPAHPLGGRASEGRRDGGHRRHQAALPQRQLGGIFAGLAGAYRRSSSATPSGRDDGRTWLHRAGGADLRPLDADRRVRRRAAVHLPPPASAPIQIAPPEGALGEFLSTLPSQFYSALPYIITIIVLAGVVGRRGASRGRTAA